MSSNTLFCFFLAACLFLSPEIITAQKGSPTPNLKVAPKISKTANQSLVVAVVFDTSASMEVQPELTKVLFDSLSTFIEQNLENEYLIVDANSSPRLLLKGSSDAEEIKKVIAKIKKPRLGGGTALYDSLSLVAKKITQSQNFKKVILVISDGVDTTSTRTSLDDLLNTFKGKKITVYVVNPTYPIDDISAGGEAALEKITEAAGGSVFKVKKPEDVKSAFKAIQEKIQSF